MSDTAKTVSADALGDEQGVMITFPPHVHPVMLRDGSYAIQVTTTEANDLSMKLGFAVQDNQTEKEQANEQH